MTALFNAGGGTLTGADEPAVIAAEFLRNEPARALRLRLVLTVLAVLAAGAADGLAVFELMAAKLTDAMGEPVGSAAGLVAISGVCLMAYVLMSHLWSMRQRAARVAAGLVYAVVLVVLGLVLAPSEGPAVREAWESVTSGAAFGAGDAGDAPPWAVLAGVAVLAVAYSLYGLVFLAAKAWLGSQLALWRDRACAVAVLAERNDLARQVDAVRERATLVAALESKSVADTVVAAALRQGIDAYRDALEAQCAAWGAALADLRLSKAEKQRLAAQRDAAALCLASIATFTGEQP